MASGTASRWRRKLGAGLFGLLLLVGGAACGLGDDDEPATATTAALAETPTTPVTETAQATPPTMTVAASPTVGQTPAASPTATAESTATPTTPAATATATPNPLPSGGAELLIEGEPVSRIVAVGVDGTTLYAVSGGGLARSDDGGVSWNVVGEAPPGTLLVSENDPELLYSGDRASCGRGFSEIPYSQSTDGGVTWAIVEANQGTAPLHAYSANGQAVLFGTDCGLKISVDSGATWTTVADLAGEDVFAMAAEPDAAPLRVLVVGVTEGGTGRLFLLETESITAPALIGAVTQFWANGVVDWSQDRIVLATAHQLGISDDGGETWNWTRTGLEDVSYSVDPLTQAIPNEELAAGFGFTAVKIDPTDRNRIWLGSNDGGFRSFDGGVSWESLGDSEPVESIVASTLSGRVFVSSGGTTRLWTFDGQ